MSSNLKKNQLTITVLNNFYNYFFSQINYKVVDKTGRNLWYFVQTILNVRILICVVLYYIV